MALDDAPILPPATTLANAYIPLVYPAPGVGTGVVQAGITVSQLLGVLAGDIETGVLTGATISKRLSVVTGTTPTVTLPSVSGSLRNVTVLNGASGNLTLDTPGSEKIFTGTADADTVVVATGKSIQLWSNGTTWFHVSNDA